MLEQADPTKLGAGVRNEQCWDQPARETWGCCSRWAHPESPQLPDAPFLPGHQGKEQMTSRPSEPKLWATNTCVRVLTP